MNNRKIIIIPDRLAHYRVPVFESLAAQLKTDNHEVFVAADLRQDSSNIEKPTAEDLGVCSFGFKKSKDVRYKGRLIFSTASFQVIFSQFDVVVIWGDAWSLGNWVSAILLRLFTNKKLVFWTHGLYGKENFIFRHARIMFYKLAHSLLLYGRNSKELLEQSGFSERRLFVINNALDFRKQEEVYQKAYRNLEHCNSAPQNTIKLLFIGRLTSVKKLELLLDATVVLAERVAVQVKFIGDGPERERLQKLAAEYGINQHVKFLGPLYDEEEICEHMLNSHMVVAPGNVGLTAMHALIYGTPVISHNNASQQMPEFESIKEGVSGFLFKEKDVDSLVGAILKCKEAIVKKEITREGCRKVIQDYYSFTYQEKVFKKLLLQLEEV